MISLSLKTLGTEREAAPIFLVLDHCVPAGHDTARFPGGCRFTRENNKLMGIARFVPRILRCPGNQLDRVRSKLLEATVAISAFS